MTDAVLEVPIGDVTFRLRTVERDTGDLYWHTLWPAAVGLADHLVQNPERIAGRRVLELGCGVGLVALAAARCGCSLTLSDIDPDSLALARQNLADNGGGTVETAIVDWTRPPALPAFDVILGSDLVYETWLARPLAHTIHTLLAPAGIVLLADAIRSPFTDFLDEIRGFGFVFQQDLVDAVVQGRSHRIGLYTLWRRPAPARRKRSAQTG